MATPRWTWRAEAPTGTSRGTVIIKGAFREVETPTWDVPEGARAIKTTMHDVMGLTLRETARMLGMSAHDLSRILHGEFVLEPASQYDEAVRILRGGDA